MSALTTNSPNLIDRLPIDGIREHLRNKLFVSLAAILALTLLVCLVSIFGQIQQVAIINRVVSVDTRIGQLNSEVLDTVRGIHLAEINYFNAQADIGAVTARSLYLVPWEGQLSTVDRQLDEVAALMASSDSELSNSVPEIKELLTIYEAQTLESVELAQQLGSDDSGLWFEKRRAAAALESRLYDPEYEQTLLAFLRVRQAEDNFFLSADSAYIDEMDSQIAIMREQIGQFGDMASEDQAALATALVDYRSIFDEIVSLTAQLNQILTNNSTVIGEIEHLVEDVLRASLSDVDSAEREVFNLVTRNIIIVVLLTVATVVGAILLARTLVTRLTTQSDELVDFFKAVDQEDIDARAKVVSHDELGKVATTLNQILEERQELLQTSERRQKIESSIADLIVDMERASLGDLSNEAAVSMEITDVIADSFNFVIEQMRQIILQVQEATSQVTLSTNEIQSTAEQLASGTETQVEQIIDTSAAIDEMSVSIQKVSRNSTLSASIGNQARTTALRGAEATQQIMSSLEAVRDQIDSTGEMVDNLNKDATELSDIVRLIDLITERTSVLALNASIQASAAGEAGRGFLAVATDVESLATQSAEANTEIKHLIHTIQQETEAAHDAVQNTRTEVQFGLQLAQEAGNRLTEIESVTNNLAELIQSISQASQQQARGSESIARSMNEIATVSQETASGTHNTSQSVRSLATIADNLRSFVDRFKLS